MRPHQTLSLTCLPLISVLRAHAQKPTLCKRGNILIDLGEQCLLYRVRELARFFHELPRIGKS